MSGRRGWVAAAVLALCLAVNLGWIAGHLDWLRPLTVGAEAPALAVPTVGVEGAAGPPVTIGGPRDKVMVVEFWATWCKPCLASLPKIDRAAAAWGDAVEVVAVNVDDAAAARAIFDRERYRLTLAADADHASERYGVYSLPHLIVIDRAGVVRRMTGRADDAIAAAERLRTAAP